MNAAICDRCEKTVKESASITIWPVKPASSPIGVPWEHSKDLCAECHAELLKFLKIATVTEEPRK